MTLDEAISHAEEMAKLKERDAERWNWHAKIWSGENRNHAIKRVNECTKCAEEHYQLAQWLKLLKRIMDSGDCNNCSQLNSQCRYAPGWGEQVRYNCPFYGRRTDE